MPPVRMGGTEVQVRIKLPSASSGDHFCLQAGQMEQLSAHLQTMPSKWAGGGAATCHDYQRLVGAGQTALFGPAYHRSDGLLVANYPSGRRLKTFWRGGASFSRQKNFSHHAAKDANSLHEDSTSEADWQAVRSADSDCKLRQLMQLCWLPASSGDRASYDFAYGFCAQGARPLRVMSQVRMALT